MGENKIKLDQAGRILIPSSFRKALGMKRNDFFVLRVRNGILELVPAKVAAKAAQGLVKRYAKERSLSKELIDERAKEE